MPTYFACFPFVNYLSLCLLVNSLVKKVDIWHDLIVIFFSFSRFIIKIFHILLTLVTYNKVIATDTDLNSFIFISFRCQCQYTIEIIRLLCKVFSYKENHSYNSIISIIRVVFLWMPRSYRTWPDVFQVIIIIWYYRRHCKLFIRLFHQDAIKYLPLLICKQDIVLDLFTNK
jgi:hypothetical protein